ncbi:hypothetical protein KRMM14A1004_38680 [Krasilnikovia sp. MM14-A1004]
MHVPRLIGRQLAALIVAAVTVLACPTASEAATRPGSALPYYFWITSTKSVKCLTVADASTAEDAPVVQQTCSDTAYNQFWTFLNVDDVHFMLVAGHSRKCLAVADASTVNGGRVVQQRCTGAANEQWSFPYLEGNNYLAVARHSGKCLTVAGGSTAEGAPVIQRTCRGTTDQQWRLGF